MSEAGLTLESGTKKVSDPGQPVFQVKDRVYAKDGAGVYAADVLKVALKPLKTSRPDKDSGPMETAYLGPQAEGLSPMVWKYFVHYLGWNKKWDKWVTNDDLLADDEHGKSLHRKFQEKEQERKDQERREAEAKRLAKKRKKLHRAGGDDAMSVGSAGFLDNSSSAPMTHTAGEGKADSVIDSISMKRLLLPSEDDDDVDGPEKKKNRTEGGSVVSKDPLSIPAEETKPPLELPFTLKTVLLDDRDKIVPPTSHKAFAQPTPEEWYATRFLPCLPTNAITVRQCVDTFLSRKITQYKQKLKRRKRGIPSEIGSATSDTEDKKAESQADNKECGDSNDKSEETKTIELWRDIMEDFLRLFDTTLPSFLLYHQERAQYYIYKQKCEQKKINFRHCEVYSCVYLLRFFERLPIIIEQVLPLLLAEEEMEGKAESSNPLVPSIMTEWKNTEALVDELIRYNQRNVTRLFPHKYREPYDFELTPYERKCKERAVAMSSKKATVQDSKMSKQVAPKTS